MLGKQKSPLTSESPGARYGHLAQGPSSGLLRGHSSGTQDALVDGLFSGGASWRNHPQRENGVGCQQTLWVVAPKTGKVGRTFGGNRLP